MRNEAHHLFLFSWNIYYISFLKQCILTRICMFSSHLQTCFSQTQFVFVPYRSLTRNIIRPGTASWEETLAATWLMRPSISFTSTWVKWLFCCSSQAKGTHFVYISWPYSTDWLDKGTYHSLARGRCLFLCCFLLCCFWGYKKTWPC